jgi:hypothetical protein
MPLLCAAAALLVLGVLAFGLRRRRGGTGAGAGSATGAGAAGKVSAAAAASMFLDLRSLVFSTDPAAACIPDPVPGTCRGTWGIVMEIGAPAGVATVVALGDGTASLYTSSGGGTIGAGRHERVHRAAVSFVEAADREGTAGDPTSDPPLPRTREVRFHWLTRGGMRTAAASEAALVSGRHALTRLYGVGQGLLEELRRTGSG